MAEQGIGFGNDDIVFGVFFWLSSASASGSSLTVQGILEEQCQIQWSSREQFLLNLNFACYLELCCCISYSLKHEVDHITTDNYISLHYAKCRNNMLQIYNENPAKSVESAMGRNELRIRLFYCSYRYLPCYFTSSKSASCRRNCCYLSAALLPAFISEPAMPAEHRCRALDFRRGGLKCRTFEVGRNKCLTALEVSEPYGALFRFCKQHQCGGKACRRVR